MPDDLTDAERTRMIEFAKADMVKKGVIHAGDTVHCYECDWTTRRVVIPHGLRDRQCNEVVAWLFENSKPVFLQVELVGYPLLWNGAVYMVYVGRCPKCNTAWVCGPSLQYPLPTQPEPEAVPHVIEVKPK